MPLLVSVWVSLVNSIYLMSTTASESVGYCYEKQFNSRPMANVSQCIGAAEEKVAALCSPRNLEGSAPALSSFKPLSPSCRSHGFG